MYLFHSYSSILYHTCEANSINNNYDNSNHLLNPVLYQALGLVLSIQ